MANDKDPLLGALGICRKAGKLLHGYDRVEEAVMRGKACLVLLACDASKRTTQHMQDTCAGDPLRGDAAERRGPAHAYAKACCRICGYGRKPCTPVCRLPQKQVKEDSANG